ncbi:MAG: ABC transporter ATP-binding protein, partial [Patescibacteria group bacterium]|nr:ABC transporter ATP-binding protein [Patescibacteria group bacterium]
KGMKSRLAFSTTIFCVKNKNLDIVLLDEVLNSGGDINFQQKATLKMEEFIEKGAAIIMVSHDLSDIKKYCRKTILLDNGKIIDIGQTDKIIEKYIKL